MGHDNSSKSTNQGFLLVPRPGAVIAPQHQQLDASSDDSTRSTIPNTNHKPRSSSQSPRTVRFDLNATSVIEPEAVVQEDGASAPSLWYSCKELAAFQLQTRELAWILINQQPVNGSLQAYERVMNRTYRVCCVVQNDTAAMTLVPGVRQLLKSTKDEDNLGMEKWIVDAILHDCTARRQQSWRVVQRLQADPLTENLPQALSDQTSRITRPCVLFARIMAQAQV